MIKFVDSTVAGAAKCVFCQLIRDGRYDQKLSSPDSVIVFEPLDPVVPGHLLAVPVWHVRDAAHDAGVAALTMRKASVVVKMLGISANIITSIGAAATQSIYHLHLHIVPRVEGDGITLPWTGQVKQAGSAGPPVLPPCGHDGSVLRVCPFQHDVHGKHTPNCVCCDACAVSCGDEI